MWVVHHALLLQLLCDLLEVAKLLSGISGAVLADREERCELLLELALKFADLLQLGLLVRLDVRRALGKVNTKVLLDLLLS